jgi:hypothetical protein
MPSMFRLPSPPTVDHKHFPTTRGKYVYWTVAIGHPPATPANRNEAQVLKFSAKSFWLPSVSSWPAGVGASLFASFALAEVPTQTESVRPADPVEARVEEPGLSSSLSICVASHENAQLARLSGGFLEALFELESCSDSSCPEALREDCAEWRKELKLLIPTVVVAVRAPTGDIDDAQVEIDGKPVRERLDGRKFSLNPGKHVIRVETRGSVQERTLVLVEGEGTRLVVFEFEETASLDRGPQTASTVPPTTARPVPPLSYALGGTALVSLGLAIGFGVSALTASQQARERCAPVCDPSVSRAVNERSTVADVALGVSVLSFAGAALVYAYRPEVKVLKEPKKLEVRGGRDGGQLLIGGVF